MGRLVITNFPHGTREALHLGYEEVSGWNPRVIYADITGFGDAGPDARLPGFDLTAFWSRTGLLAATRDAGAPPTSPPWGQHAAELADVLEAEFRSQPLAHWKEVLDTARIPYGVMQSPEEAAADPQLRAANIVVPIEGARDLDYTVNKPISCAGWPGCLSGAHPSAGSTPTKSLHSWDSAPTTSPSGGSRK